MIKNIKDETLVEALSFCGVRELPEELKGKEVWIKAIGLASKVDGSQSYVYLERGKLGAKDIKKDFGTLSPIAKIDKIYPYLYLSEDEVPKFSKEDKGEKTSWLIARGYKEEELSTKTPQQINKLVIDECVKAALNKDKMAK